MRQRQTDRADRGRDRQTETEEIETERSREVERLSTCNGSDGILVSRSKKERKKTIVEIPRASPNQISLGVILLSRTHVYRISDSQVYLTLFFFSVFLVFFFFHELIP